MSRLDDILSEELEREGFALFEDDHFVYVKRCGEVCLVFSSSGATRESILEGVELLRGQEHLITAHCEIRGGER